MELFLVTFITCNQLFGIVSRIERHLKLTPQQKMELTQELKKQFKTCPIVIKKN